MYNMVNKKKPNVIFFILDDQGIGDVVTDPHDSPNYLPSLKKLAQKGIICTNAYANSPMCAPARTAIMIGGYSQRIGVYELHDTAPGIPNSVKIAPQFFKEKGYRTGLIGKWHLGGQLDLLTGNEEKAMIPKNKGFDTSFYFFGSTHDYWNENYGNSEINAPGYPIYSPMYDDGIIVNEMDYLTTEINNRSIKFIEENKDQPFFLAVTHHTCHVPLQVPKEFHDKYQGLELGELASTSRAMYEVCDNGLGLIMDKLEELGIDDNTIIIYTSDNGGAAPSGPTVWNYSGAKFNFGQGGLRIPFVISWPNVLPQNKVYADMVMQMDMLPTVLEAAGIEGPGREGVSLIPYLMSEMEGSPHKEAYWSHGHINNFAVYKDGFKLRMDQYCPGALHNVIDDPFEIQDLSTIIPEKVEELFWDYKLWMSKNPKNLPNQDENYYKREKEYLEKIKDDPIWEPKDTTSIYG